MKYLIREAKEIELCPDYMGRRFISEQVMEAHYSNPDGRKEDPL
jgi:hypothetical protein